jgi:hypothetical protein
MENSINKQGETLMILVHRSGLSGKQAAEKLEIHPTHLSKLFRSEFLTEKIRRKACEVFGQPSEIWEDPEKIVGGGMVSEGELEYRRAARAGDPVLERLETIERLLEEMRDTTKERLRLLGIIETITGASAPK